MTDTPTTATEGKAFNWLYGMFECNGCGMGFRAREMGQVGGRRFCARCLADALRGSYVLVNAARDTCNRYREALEWYADHTIYEPAFANGGDDPDSHGMKSLAGIDSGSKARDALQGNAQ